MSDQTLSIQPSAEADRPRRRPWLAGITIALLIAVVLVSAAIRLMVDVPNIASGTVPSDPYAARFARHHWLAYLHIGPGLLYLVGVPLQLAYRFRRNHYPVHRRLGRLMWVPAS